MNQIALTRKATVYKLNHPKVLRVYLKIKNSNVPTLPKGYRKIVKK